MSESLTDRLIRHEGLRLCKYRDSLGNWSVGVGHLITAADGDKYDTPLPDRDAALALLDSDLTAARNDLYGNYPWTMSLDSVRLGALIEMMFQLGIHKFSEFKDMLADLHHGNYEDAAYEMLDSLWHHQTPARCEELANLISSGQLPNLSA